MNTIFGRRLCVVPREDTHTKHRRLIGFVGALALAALPLHSASGQQISALTPVAEEPAPEIAAWYTEAQADSGRNIFTGICGGCHGTNLIEIFSLYEDGSRFFNFISGSMPADNPGGLSTRDYLDVTAYLMREIGFPSGPDALVRDRAVLSLIKPKASREVLGYAAYDEQYDPGYTPPVGTQP